MHDEDYETAAAKWIADFAAWEPKSWCKYFWEYDHPPDEDYHRPAFTAPADWYQVYETVSEGTPVSPPFATVEELARWLSENGDFWYQARMARGVSDYKPTYEEALAMVSRGHAMSMMVTNDASGVTIMGPYEQGNTDGIQATATEAGSGGGSSDANDGDGTRAP